MDANVDRGELGRQARAPRTVGTPAKRQDMREHEQGLLSVCACMRECVCVCTPAAPTRVHLRWSHFHIFHPPLSLKINKRSSLPCDRRSAPRVSELNRKRQQERRNRLTQPIQTGGDGRKWAVGGMPPGNSFRFY